MLCAMMFEYSRRALKKNKGTLIFHYDDYRNEILVEYIAQLPGGSVASVERQAASI